MTKDWEETVGGPRGYSHLSFLIQSTLLDISDVQRDLLDLAGRRTTAATQDEQAELDRQILTMLFDLLDLHREVVDLAHRTTDESLQSRALQQLSALAQVMESRPRQPGVVRR